VSAVLLTYLSVTLSASVLLAWPCSAVEDRCLERRRENCFQTRAVCMCLWVALIIMRLRRPLRYVDDGESAVRCWPFVGSFWSYSWSGPLLHRPTVPFCSHNQPDMFLRLICRSSYTSAKYQAKSTRVTSVCSLLCLSCFFTTRRLCIARTMPWQGVCQTQVFCRNG